jgi:hypothetical protein
MFTCVNAASAILCLVQDCRDEAPDLPGPVQRGMCMVSILLVGPIIREAGLHDSYLGITKTKSHTDSDP